MIRIQEIFVALLLGALSACASGPTLVETPAEAVDAPEDGSYVTEVSFSRGSSELDGGDKQKLDQVVFKARNNGEVDDVKVISWADKTTPPNSKVELPDSEKTLAEKRSDQIKAYLQANQALDDVDTFNMAKPASGLDEYLKTEDARVKNSLEKPKAGKAVVMVVLKPIDRE